MKIQEVSVDDGKICAMLLQFLKAGEWKLSGQDAEKLIAVKKWIHDLALLMAKDLKPEDKPKETETSFKVKAIGPIGKARKK